MPNSATCFACNFPPSGHNGDVIGEQEATHGALRLLTIAIHRQFQKPLAAKWLFLKNPPSSEARKGYTNCGNRSKSSSETTLRPKSNSPRTLQQRMARNLLIIENFINRVWGGGGRGAYMQPFGCGFRSGDNRRLFSLRNTRSPPLQIAPNRIEYAQIYVELQTLVHHAFRDLCPLTGVHKNAHCETVRL